MCDAGRVLPGVTTIGVDSHQESGKNCRMVRKTDNVVHFPTKSSEIIELVRDIGLDSSRWSVLVQYSESQERERLTNRREIDSCLKMGHIQEKHVGRDEHGCLRFKLSGITAGKNLTIDVALDDSCVTPRIYVLNVESSHA